jgi:murein DD-endopeptidase MepM/ murein hydrolase activator NlpD
VLFQKCIGANTTKQVVYILLVFQPFYAFAQTCTPFKLDRVSGCNLYWPFGVGNPLETRGWASRGYAYGEGGHTGSDYYAIDWSSNQFPVCDSPFYAPLSGKVVAVYGACSTFCAASIAVCGAYGNQILIRSDVNPDFYFRVAHLARVYVSQDETVQPRQLIGRVGGTGNTQGPHAHCVVYYIPDSNLASLSIGGGPDSHATIYNFDATCGISLVTGIGELLEKEKIKIYPNPVHEKLWIEINNAAITKLDWTLYDNNGRELQKGSCFRSGFIYMADLPKGIFFIELKTRDSKATVKILKT